MARQQDRTNKLTGPKAAYLLWAALQSRHLLFQKQSPAALLADFFINVGGLLLSLTLYSSMPGTLLALFIGPAILILALPATREATTKTTVSKKVETQKSDMPDYPRRPFLTAYRGGMLVITSIAILAVDFNVFLRRFAKVETWGTSLMDVGVGSFVFAAGLASSKSFSQNHPDSALSRSLPERFIQSIKQSLPLLILGVVRLISVKNLDYAEHVSEYGVHWNFFFTLAFLPVALCFLQPMIKALPGMSHGYMGLMLASVYEMALQTTHLKSWILIAPRTTIISQNKEGIFSCVGYLAIFLLGIETGSIVLPRRLPRAGLLYKILRSTGSQVESSRIIFLASIGFLCLTYSMLLLPFYTPRLFPWLSIPVSRRLANLPYVLWIGAYNTGQLLMFALVESLVFPSVYKASNATQEKQAIGIATSTILDDYNSGGLIIFLLANLGTGVVNLSIDTLKVRNLEAIAILTIYMAILTVLARLCRGIKLKL